jgi:hypothetical protein
MSGDNRGGCAEQKEEFEADEQEDNGERKIAVVDKSIIGKAVAADNPKVDNDEGNPFLVKAPQNISERTSNDGTSSSGTSNYGTSNSGTLNYGTSNCSTSNYGTSNYGTSNYGTSNDST